jgi:DNA topoisomerase-2
LDADIEGLLIRRVYDLTATTDKNVTIFLNDERIDCKDFEKYVDMYIGPKTETKRVYEELDENGRWEVVVCDSSDDKFEQVSFVNGIYTFKGGKHVEAIATAISTKLAKHVESKGKKKITLKPSVIRDNMFLFVRSIIEDPSFDSQTKEYLTTVPAKFGSKFTISDKLIEKIAKLDIVDKAIKFSEYKDSKILNKTDGKKVNLVRGIPKLDDANWAGGPQSSQCTLILTEGDSAKAFAIAGLSVIGRDRYGVFPLKGKVLNVREATDDKVSKNEEVKNLKIILGLQQGKVYEDLSDLRYGSIMILTDADVDGSHIKGLLLNLFHHFWPSLLKQPGFIKSMLTPIVKAKTKTDLKVFYTLTDYENWKAAGDTSSYEIKYYKGLGTSTSQEAKEYFKDLDNSEIRYLWNEDLAVDLTINLAFNKDMSDNRKEWLGNYDRNLIIEHNQKDIPIEDFINKDLIHFSKYDCERSVPCLVDGFKPSQRKVMYGTMLKNLKKSIKVAQLSAYVAEKSAYHHGEQSLNECIVSLAQDFVGSNNMNFLDPEGNFGSRLTGGDDHASPRYIFTKMSDFMPLVFHYADSALLSYMDDDGETIEPEFYVPVIPNIFGEWMSGNRNRF